MYVGVMYSAVSGVMTDASVCLFSPVVPCVTAFFLLCLQSRSGSAEVVIDQFKVLGVGEDWCG